MAIASNLGYPRIGTTRELKKAVEAFWKGEVDETQLTTAARELRQRNWRVQYEAGIEHPPSSDFSFYDQILDMTAMLGAVPPRFDWSGNRVDFDTYFAMARGRTGTNGESDVHPMEMTKWFDTNYHYIVPELSADQDFRLVSSKPIDEYREAKSAGFETRPVLIGPVTYLLLAKCAAEEFDRLSLIERVVPIYEQVISNLASSGASTIQIDEPALVGDLDSSARAAFLPAYERLNDAAGNAGLLLATYFGELKENIDVVSGLPIEGLHIDLVQGRDQLGDVLGKLPDGMKLSLGVVDGRNIWRTDLDDALARLQDAKRAIGNDRLLVAPSCSLLHCPIDLDLETEIDDELRSWMAFSKQKLVEVATLAEALNENEAVVADRFEAAGRALEGRRQSPRVHDSAVSARLEAIRPEMTRRRSSFSDRWELQSKRIPLPPMPTTTIGSFPQTKEVRRTRAAFKRGRIDKREYERRMKGSIEETIRFQEEIGLDVLVHGEPERNDMVEYFGERLNGFAFTQHGWVQSYGSRCVKPPIIFGDVSRPDPMTVAWAKYAQSLTPRPVKGMLTGPVTILQWSFVRDDQPRDVTCRQIALAIRDEAADLEQAGIAKIQVDEAALREGLPLRRSERDDYLRWAIECFRLTTASVRDDTQIHTHMCYSEFNEIIGAIVEMDADVISIESSRSEMELLSSIDNFDYPNAIGPGVYDIHSPRVPTESEIAALIRAALKVVPMERLWINPDCGLKTRGWAEVRPSLSNMVGAARAVREEVGLAVT